MGKRLLLPKEDVSDEQAHHRGKEEGDAPDGKQQREQEEDNDGTKKNAKAAEVVTDSTNWKAGQKKKLKFTWQEQKDYETIEADIAGLEEKIELLESRMAGAATDFVKLNQLMAEKEEAESKLEEKMDRWMYLEDLAARIEAGETVE